MKDSAGQAAQARDGRRSPHVLAPPLRLMQQQVQALAEAGDIATASRVAARLCRLAPHHTSAHSAAAELLLRSGQYREAHALTLRAAAGQVNPVDLLPLARLLRRFEEPEVLERLFSATAWRDLQDPSELVELAQLMVFSGLYDLADVCIACVLQRAPTYGDGLYLRGLVDMFRGDMVASADSLQRAIAIEPRMGNAHWLLSLRDTPATAAAHAERMQVARATVRRGTEARICFDYALHHSLHVAGDYEAAWQALARGHDAMRKVAPYRSSDHHDLVESLEHMSVCTTEPPGDIGAGSTLIFIVGMFRSGTTLIERVLSGHPDVAGGGENATFSACMREATDRDSGAIIDTALVQRAPFVDFASVGTRMRAYARWRSVGRRYLTEKLPSNFLNIGFILQALPEARIVHMRRDPIETCFSNLRTLFRGGVPYACDQTWMADYFIQYQRLMRHWHAAAPGRILDVDYSDFIADPATQAQRLMLHCGLDFRPESLDLGRAGGMAATASVAHVRSGILTDRASHWKPYAAHLAPLIDGLKAAYPPPLGSKLAD